MTAPRAVGVSQGRDDTQTTSFRRRCARAAALCVLVCAAGGAAGGSAAGAADGADTTAAAARAGETARGAAPAEWLVASPLDTIERDDFRERHAFSLDHFFEWWPRFVIGRRGPIGSPADFSRYGIGKGRGVVYMGTVPLNDPQDDRVPLGMVPTSAFGSFAVGGVDGRFFPEAANIEGAYRIAEPEPPAAMPSVAFDLSKGDRDLRQRRVRLSSIAGPIGIDFEFDELLNDGYAFDARGLVDGAGYGQTSTRVQGGNVRGELEGGLKYTFSLRRYQSVLNGGLFDARAEYRRNGHVAAVKAALGAAEVSVYERSHDASSPDSVTINHTSGVVASAPARWLGLDLTLGAGYEDIRSIQRVGGEDRSRLEKAHIGAAGRASLPGGIRAVVEASATHYFYAESGWGAGLRLGRALAPRSHVVVEIHRRFRMPNLGELFGPRHRLAMDPALETAGNRHAGEESAFEGTAAWLARVGGLTNEVRATGLRVQDPILYGPSPGEPSLVTPQNGGSEEIVVIEDRAHFQQTVLGAVFEIAGSIEYAPGDRSRFFEGVPDHRATAWAAIGRDFFKKTSGVRLSAEYLYSGPRKSGSEEPLTAYGVVNLKLDVRIIDARLYVQLLNVTDERYQTVWPYLMTPRTFAYGVEWTIFD